MSTCPGAGNRVPFGRIEDVKRSGGREVMAAMTDLLGERHIMIPAGSPVVRMTDLPAELSGLAAEFPGYEFATQQTWGGISIIARTPRRAAHGQACTPLSPTTWTSCAARFLSMSGPSHQGDSRHQP